MQKPEKAEQFMYKEAILLSFRTQSFPLVAAAWNKIARKFQLVDRQVEFFARRVVCRRLRL